MRRTVVKIDRVLQWLAAWLHAHAHSEAVAAEHENTFATCMWDLCVCVCGAHTETTCYAYIFNSARNFSRFAIMVALCGVAAGSGDGKGIALYAMLVKNATGETNTTLPLPGGVSYDSFSA